MKLPRFSIGGVLAVIAIFAVALAALRTPSYLWANVTFSLALGAIVIATINAIYGRGASRAYWFGFALCGAVYFALCSVPGLRESICPRLVTEVALDLLYPHLSPPATTPNLPWTTVFLPPGTPGVPSPLPAAPYPDWTYAYALASPGANGSGGPVTLAQPYPSQWAAWNVPDRSFGIGSPIGTVALCSSEAYRRIGHAMFTLLFAVLGGTYTRHRYRIGIVGRLHAGSTPST